MKLDENDQNMRDTVDLLKATDARLIDQNRQHNEGRQEFMKKIREIERNVLD